MSYEFYKVLHLLGIFMVIATLGGMILHVANGGTRDFMLRKRVSMVHGVGLLLALIGGFGLLARLGLVNGLPTWAIAKLVIWLTLGALPALVYRKRELAKYFMPLMVGLAAIAGYLAIYKPF
ncbi:MAG: hypothetical protein V4760_05940 [Bdellovibrionota bacterium]